MASPLARSAASLLVSAVFAACGGVADPHLFGPSNSAGAAGTVSRGGASPAGGESARAGADQGGTSSPGGNSAAGADSDAGAADGGRANAGSSNAGAGGGAQAGAGGSAGSNRGGSGGTTSGGTTSGGTTSGGAAGSPPNAGSGGSDNETCQTLLAKANQQLAAAQVCSLAADAMQCTGTVKNTCDCEVPVNRKESAETKSYELTLAELNKKHCVQACTTLVCFPASHANCLASAIGSAAGKCVTGLAAQF